MGIIQVKDMDEFKDQLEKAGEKLVVIDFFATWCGPCKMISPKIDKMSDKMEDKVVFLKVDVDEAEEIALEYKVTAMPTFVLIKNKEKVDELTGADAAKLKKIIQKNA